MFPFKVEQLRGAGVESQNKLMEKQKQQLQQLQNQHRERLEHLINQKVGNNVEKTLHDDKTNDCPNNNVGFNVFLQVTAANMEQKSQLEIWVEQLWREEKKRTDAQHYEQMKHFREQVN